MLSAIQGRLNSLEKEIKDRNPLLEQLEKLLENDKHDREISKSLQSQIKEITFKTNGMMNVLYHQHQQIGKLEESHNFNINDFHENGTIIGENEPSVDDSPFTYNPLASEFKPHRESETENGNIHSAVIRRPTADPIRVEDPPHTDRAPEEDPTGTKAHCEQTSRLKRKIYELEAVIKKKDDLIDKLSADDVDLSVREKEFAQKTEWFEHKMRLLKQDKRRRGETIGKLLRCIDDLKDQGRVDESKVTEGRLVLQASLNSRGWAPEERVKATIRAMEADRASSRTPYGAERMPSSAANNTFGDMMMNSDVTQTDEE